jgi:hypothetical protein
MKGTRLVGHVIDLRFLAPDVAVLHAYGGTVMRGKREPAPERDSLQTMVAVRRDDRWQLVTFRTPASGQLARTPRDPALARNGLVLEMVPAEAAAAPPEADAERWDALPGEGTGVG